MAKGTVIEQVSNEGMSAIESGIPYAALFSVSGTADLLFHRWSVDGIEAKSKAAKGSKAKKQDDLETFVYRSVNGEICIPGEYFRMAIIGAAKFRQDPRSPRKSAMDLFKAGIAVLDPLCSLGTKDWGYVDRRRVMIQRSGITRSRPAMRSGWACEVLLQILLPEYITPEILNEVVQSAGRLIGVGDFRPTYGRFQVTGFSIS